MRPEPLFKFGDRVFIIETPYVSYINDRAHIGTVCDFPKWSDTPDTNYGDGCIINWKGPGGWIYMLNVDNQWGEQIDYSGIYHELELVKLCS